MRLLVSLLFISILLSGCAVVRPLNLPVSQQQPPDIHPKKPIRVLLVLGSGGVRGVAEAGVIKVLAGAGVPIDAIVGTSAGGIVGALYASNPNPSDLAYEMIKAKRKQVVKFNIFNMNKGLISGYTLQRYLINHIPTGLYFRNLKIPFGIMTTDFVTGRAHFINSGVIAPAVNASSSVPGVFRVVSLYGHQFVDGGVSAPLGTEKARQFYKPDLLIAISIHVDLDPKIPSSMMDKIGRGVDVIETNLEREQFRYADIVIHPRVGDLGALSTGDNVHLYRQGIIAAKRKLPLILRAMKRKGIKRVARR